MDSIQAALIGQSISSIVTNGDDYLALHTTGGVYHLQLDGDCCSRSYLTHIRGVTTFLDKGVITEVLDASLGEGKGGDCISQHALILRCSGGDSYAGAPTLIILWENESNGYYDGSIGLCEAPNLPMTSLQDITKNWEKEK